MFWIRQQLVNKMGLVQTDTTEQTHVFGTAAPVGHWGRVLVLGGVLVHCRRSGMVFFPFVVQPRAKHRG